MMYNYPFFSFPHFRRYPNYYSVQSPYMRQTITNRLQQQENNMHDYAKEKNKYSKENYSKQNEPKKERNSSKKIPSGFSFLGNFLNQQDRGEDEEYFDLFGLKLYNDDLLLIGLIFFLYKEDVKDQYLFFALILLLLS